MNKSEKYFDLLSHVYDQATKKPGSWNPPDVIYENIKKKISKDSVVLDIGIGTGHSIEKIYNSGVYKEIYGADVSIKMLDVCKIKYPNTKLIHITSVNDISSIGGDFDIVISSGTLEFVEDIGSLIKQIRRKQKKDGFFIFTYEPIILFHPFQKESKSLTVPDKSSNLYMQDFYTYRCNPHQIMNLLIENNYNVTKDIEFISYKKGDENIIYHVVLAVAN